MNQMVKNLHRMFVLVLVASSLMVVFAGGGSLLAVNEDPCKVNPTSEYCQSRNTPAEKDPVTETIQKVTSVASYVAGVIAIFWIIIMGIKMQTSYGNAEKVQAARKGIIYASVGLVVVIISRLVILLVMKLIS
jgi:hypothetical protein